MISLVDSFRSYAVKFPTKKFSPIWVEQLGLQNYGDPDCSGGLDFSILWRCGNDWVLNEHGNYFDNFLRDYWNEL